MPSSRHSFEKASFDWTGLEQFEDHLLPVGVCGGECSSEALRLEFEQDGPGSSG